MEWTAEQKQAINYHGGNILVSAGAGSGKTAVLSARILNSVLDREDRCDIDRLAVMTFTEAAAAEMRGRVYDALEERLQKGCDSDAARAKVSEQQIRLSGAWFSTIHGFCHKILKENVKESGIDASFGVLDDSRREELVAESIADACEEFGTETPELYAQLVDNYGSYRDDRRLKELLAAVFEKAGSLPDPEAWLEDSAKAYDSFPEGDFARTRWGRKVLEYTETEVEAALELLKVLRDGCAEFGFERHLAVLEADFKGVEEIDALLRQPETGWQELSEKFAALSFGKMPGGQTKAEKALLEDEDARAFKDTLSDQRKQVASSMGSLKTGLLELSQEVLEAERQLCAENMHSVSKIVRKARKLYARKKREIQVIDFDDMEHLCLKILSEKGPDGSLKPSAVAKKYADYFRELYIDEYQDNSVVQDRVMQMISGSDGPRRFMVGDMKQSIYRFRNADYRQFLEKYNEYGRTPEESETGDKLILLGHNFRSRHQIIDTVNAVFSEIMKPETAGMPYNKKDYLRYGATLYDAADAEAPVTGAGATAYLSDPHAVEVIAIEKRKGDNKVRRQAFEVACRVKELVGSGFLVYEKDKGMRPMRFGDVCVILRATSSHGREFSDYLEYFGVPARAPESKDNLLLRPEVAVMTSFLRVLDNPLNDIPLAAVLRNVYGFDTKFLAKFGRPVQGNEGNSTQTGDNVSYLADRLRQAAETETAEADSDVVLLCAVLKRIDKLREDAVGRPVAETLRECMNENGFADAVRNSKNGGANYTNLVRLLQYAAEFDKRDHGGVYGFLNLVRALEKSGELSPASGSAFSDDAVQVYTIHKSKGLEFPVVFLCLAETAKNNRDTAPDIVTDAELGFAGRCFDAEKNVVYSSAMREAVRQKINADNRGEELRLLYVAMTRAREKLIITGTVADFDKFVADSVTGRDDSGHVRNFSVLKASSYLKLLGLALARADVRVSGASDAPFGVIPSLYADQYEELFPAEEQDGEAGEDEYEDNGEGGESPAGAPVFELPRVPVWQPPEETETAAELIVPAKVSVSELKRRYEDDRDPDGEKDTFRLTETPVYRKIGDADETARQNAALAGTLLHLCMEHLDYGKVTKDRAQAEKYAQELADGLVNRGFMTAEERKLLPEALLADYICSDFAAFAAQAEEMAREIPFTMTLPRKYREVLKIRDEGDRETTVQGVMDCVFRRGGRLYLLDFKSDRTDTELTDYSEKYRIQLEIYAAACERALGQKPDRALLYYLRYGKAVSVQL